MHTVNVFLMSLELVVTCLSYFRADPDCLGCKSEFEQQYVKPIELAQKHDANKRELAFGRRRKL